MLEKSVLKGKNQLVSKKFKTQIIKFNLFLSSQKTTMRHTIITKFHYRDLYIWCTRLINSGAWELKCQASAASILCNYEKNIIFQEQKKSRRCNVWQRAILRGRPLRPESKSISMLPLQFLYPFMSSPTRRSGSGTTMLSMMRSLNAYIIIQGPVSF